MNELMKEIENWFKDRPLWLQDAARRIIENGEIASKDVHELIELCKNEAGLGEAKIKPRGIPVKALMEETEGANLRIDSISEVTGINALSSRKPLKFGDSMLTVIYGENGSGKSGYVRILKNVCGARKVGNLLTNVFCKKSPEQSCKIIVTNDLGTHDIYWTPQMGVKDILRDIEIFDSECAHVYINEENEVTYEPPILNIFTQLTKWCSRIQDELKKEAEKLVSKKPLMPDNYKDSKVGKWYVGITYKTNQSDIDAVCNWTPEDEKKLNGLKAILIEANPLEKAKKIRNAKSYCDKLHDKLQKIKNSFTDEKCRQYLLAKLEAFNKRKVVDEDAQKVFSGSSLEGVGTESWKLLWEQARLYSEEVAYRDKPFPFVGEEAKCVLCQQILLPEAKARLLSFEQFVKSKLEQEALSAEQKVKEIVGSLEEVPNASQLDDLMNLASINEEKVRKLIYDYCRKMEERKISLLKANKITAVTSLAKDDVLSIVLKHSKNLGQQASVYEEDAKKENRDKLQKNVKELEARKWISQQKKCVVDEVERLKKLQLYEKAKRLVNTRSLSQKKSALAEELITAEYIARFNQELEWLGGGRIKVELEKTRTVAGQVYYKIKLKDCVGMVKTSDVLSEGELRIVSLAGFLADVRGKKGNAPFIFDDPISSLDQIYEEKTVERIVELCKERQVIVFTHRLSTLALLQSAAKKSELKADVICLQREYSGVGEPNDIPIYGHKPQGALNKLLNDRLPKAKKVYKEIGRTEYRDLAIGICIDFRIILERLIENDLLLNIVQRFRREICTKDKIQKLAEINLADCQLFERLITEYSKFVHSQSPDVSVLIPKPEEIENDIKQVNAWLKDFRRRTR